MFDTTRFSRRRLLEIGAGGVAGLGALSIPLGGAAAGKQGRRLDSPELARPDQAAFGGRRRCHPRRPLWTAAG